MLNQLEVGTYRHTYTNMQTNFLNPPIIWNCAFNIYSKTCLKRPLKKNTKKLVFNTDYHLMQVKGEHSAILLTFIKLPFSIKTVVLSIFKWPLKTGFTVY